MFQLNLFDARVDPSACARQRRLLIVVIPMNFSAVHMYSCNWARSCLRTGPLPGQSAARGSGGAVVFSRQPLGTECGRFVSTKLLPDCQP